MLVLTTEASLENAERLAKTLLEERLVACVSLMPILSLYQWRGQLTRSEEVQLLIKTHRPCLEALRERVLDLHSYDTPEWISLEAQTHGTYGQWCAEQLLGPALREGGEPRGPSMNPGGEDPIG